MEKEITIKANDGSGSFSAYVCYPAKTPAPAVLVIQEIFGVNAVMRGICQDLAAQGYIAICPDLFWRQEPGIQITDKSEAEWKRAFELFQGFNLDAGIEDLKATLAAIRQDKDCTGKAGAVGYCLGGKLAYLMSTRSDVDGSVSYYGVDIPSFLNESSNIKTPLLMHVAEKDKFVPPDAQQKILRALGQERFVQLHVYPGADHAFARVGGEHYDRDAAHLANSRTALFLKENLSG